MCPFIKSMVLRIKKEAQNRKQNAKQLSLTPKNSFPQVTR